MELNKAVLDCMRALRRRLRDELAVDIHLNQPDAVEAMLLACMRSSEQATRELGIRLAELSDFHSAPVSAATQAVARQYRGHALAPGEKPTQPSPAPAAEEERSSVRMYRGQRIYT